MTSKDSGNSQKDFQSRQDKNFNLGFTRDFVEVFAKEAYAPPDQVLAVLIQTGCLDLVPATIRLMDFKNITPLPLAFEPALEKIIAAGEGFEVLQKLIFAGYPISRMARPALRFSIMAPCAKMMDFCLSNGAKTNHLRPYQIMAVMNAFDLGIRLRVFDAAGGPQSHAMKRALVYTIRMGLDREARFLISYGVRIDRSSVGDIDTMEVFLATKAA